MSKIALQEMMKCPKCEKEIPIDATYCGICGAEPNFNNNGKHTLEKLEEVSGSFPNREHLEKSKSQREFNRRPKVAHAVLVIERGVAAGTEFYLTADDSYLGRWDADNGIFPDVDLDMYDPESKVSRRHAKIIKDGENYYIEDLGSTNGTFINRGKRLTPGMRQKLEDGDEIIVGKTFLRFHVLQKI
jgi:serine/threonine-protein kinase